MGAPTHRGAVVADPHQGENLRAFLHRINFSLDSVESSPRKPSPASLSSAASDNTTFGAVKNPPLQTKTNGSTPNPVLPPPRCFAEGALESSRRETLTPNDFARSTLLPLLLNPHPKHQQNSAEERSSTPTSVSTKGSETQALEKEASSSIRPDKPRHELPVYALSQTLRASSIGATMAPGIPTDSSGLGWSKYAPTVQHDGSSKAGLNLLAAERIARQAEIDARLSKLRSRREPTTEQHDETRRLELIAAQHAAEDKHARIKAVKENQAFEEAARLEVERVKRKNEELEQDRAKRQKEEVERIKREKGEAKRIQHDKEEAERIQREKEEAERLQREREEAERIQREKEEAERLQREREEAERIQRERKEAERIQREKEEAALRAALYDRIDELEEDGLSKTQTVQLELQKSIEQSAERQEQLTRDMSAKQTEVDQVQVSLQHLQNELQILQEAEASITAKIEEDTNKCAELQTVSEQIMEHASSMRKKVEDESLKSLDMIEVFDIQDKIYPQTIPAAEDSKPMLEDQPSTNSTQTPSEITEVAQESAEVARSEDKVEQDSANGVGISQDGLALSELHTVENGNVKEPIRTKPAKPVPSKKKTSGNKSLENQLKFDEWPGQEARPFGGAQKRLIKLTNLPISSSVADIQALVWGGRIESFSYTPGNSFAWVLFMRGQDCEKYFTATANGIEHPDGKRTIWVEMGDPVSVNETLRGLYDAGHTRCVRAVGADEDWGETALVKLASAKQRKLERIVNGANPKGLRVIEFRFTNIVDAGRFKVELQNDIDWEHCNVYFGTDPCEVNTGIHQGVQ